MMTMRGRLALTLALVSMTNAASALEIRPFIQYYRADGSTSAQDDEVIQAAADYWREINDPSGCLFIVGRTDTVGTSEDNMRRSLVYAQRVGDRLAQLGVDPAVLRISGKGESSLNVETPDETAEPLNRNVEVYFDFGACPPLPNPEAP